MKTLEGLPWEQVLKPQLGPGCWVGVAEVSLVTQEVAHRATGRCHHIEKDPVSTSLQFSDEEGTQPAGEPVTGGQKLAVGSVSTPHLPPWRTTAPVPFSWRPGKGQGMTRYLFTASAV